MSRLIYLLVIIFFLFLFLFNLFQKPLVEGLEQTDDSTKGATYKEYSDDPLILAQQNAGNIQSLKDQVDELLKTVDEMKPKQDQMQDQIEANTNTIQSVIQGQQDQGLDASGMNSDDPPTDITGLD
jgi:TolA-binding protein